MSQFHQGPHDPVLRPRDLGQILDQTFKVYFRYFKPLVAVGLLSAIPLLLMVVVMFFLISGDFENTWLFEMIVAMDEGDFSGFATLMSLFGLLGLAFLFLIPLYQGAVIDVATRAVLHMDPVPLRESLAVGARRYWPLLGTAVLQGLILFGTVMVSPFIGLIIFAIITVPLGIAVVYTWIMFANHAVVVEGRGGGFQAIGRSYELAKSRFWPLVGFNVVLYLMAYFLQMMVLMPVTFAMMFATMASESLTSLPWIYFFQGLVQALLLPFLVVAKTVLYFDVRVRREAYDLEVMARQAQGPNQGPPPITPPPDPRL